MRTAFIQELIAQARLHSDIFLIVGDLGFSVVEPFAQEFPDRFLNAGVAEQNMTGVAAGLASEGYNVFTYSIANFPTMRCLEQIRNDVCYHRLNVTVVAVGGGLAYGALGYTHFAIEDLAVMRSLPDMTVVAPGDPVEAKLATAAVPAHSGPCYLRLGKAHEPVVYCNEPRFQLGRAILVRPGSDITFMSTGGVLKTVVNAAEMLVGKSVSARVLSMPTVQPLDEQAVRDAARETRLVCVVEEHHVVGGLSDAVARCLAGQNSCPVRFVTLDTTALLADAAVGTQAYLTARSGIRACEVCNNVTTWLGRNQQ